MRHHPLPLIHRLESHSSAWGISILEYLLRCGGGTPAGSQEPPCLGACCRDPRFRVLRSITTDTLLLTTYPSSYLCLQQHPVYTRSQYSTFLPAPRALPSLPGSLSCLESGMVRMCVFNHGCKKKRLRRSPMCGLTHMLNSLSTSYSGTAQYVSRVMTEVYGH